jgi:hypothetical protein
MLGACTVAEEEVAEEKEAEKEVAEEEKVATHFYCSGSHLGEWMGARRPAVGSRTSTRSTSSGCETGS